MASLRITRADYEYILANSAKLKKMILKEAKEHKKSPRPSERTILGKALTMFTTQDLDIEFIEEGE